MCHCIHGGHKMRDQIGEEEKREVSVREGMIERPVGK